MINGNKQSMLMINARAQLIDGFNNFIDEIEKIYKIELDKDLEKKTEPLSPEDYINKSDIDTEPTCDENKSCSDLRELTIAKIRKSIQDNDEHNINLDYINSLSKLYKTLAEVEQIDRSF